MNRYILAAALSGLLVLGACGGGGGSGPTTTRPDDQKPTQPTSDPAYHLGTARFTAHQPDVLEQIGAHHAYARGLTGRGVRIGVDDTIVEYTQTAEFGNRVKLRDADGASLSYPHPFGDDLFSDVGACELDPTCQLWKGDSQGDAEAYNRWVRDIVSQDGWPTTDDSVFFVDEHYSEIDPFESLFRWREVPTPYGVVGSHGTIVASVAAGTNLGVAPGSTIIPIAENLTDDQLADRDASDILRRAIALLSPSDRRQVDGDFARVWREHYSNFDIINRSYGVRLSALTGAQTTEEARWFNTYLPETLDALWQVDTPASDKTIIVYAAGNDSDPYPRLGAVLPYAFPELRDHTVAVAATDPRTGAIHQDSNRCGSLPQDWNAARHGPHYCLAAPGVVRGLVPNPNTPGNGDIGDGLFGTSYAAPIVSGSLALLMEHFRGTRGNTAVVKRMLDTADRSGRYADLETYGAGHLDLEAALSPVGSLNAGQSAEALSRTTLQVPAAYGSVAGRVAGLELAAFDEKDFPFWVPMTTLISTRPAGRSPIPQLAGAVEDPLATDPDAFGLHWMPAADDDSLWLADGHGWVTGFGPTSASLARLPHDGGWGYGLSFDDAGYLGSRTSGAFGSDPRSGMIWTSRALKHDLDGGWSLDVVGTLALGVPQYEDDAIFQASASVLSAMSMRVGTDGWGLTVEQPLRAESGTGSFRIENGHMEGGRRLHDVYRVPLAPDAREIRVTLRHDREALGGDVALEVSGAADTGHVSGERDASIGLAYRTTW